MGHSTKLELAQRTLHLKSPLRMTGSITDRADVLVVTLKRDGVQGHGEASGVAYLGESVGGMRYQLERIRPRIEEGISRTELLSILPPGGARNAVDCALWDLEARLTRRAVWELAGLEMPRPLVTTFTCGADEPARMAEVAASYFSARAIKLKLLGDGLDGDRVWAVRDAKPDAWLAVDGNQGFTPTTLDSLMPTLMASNVALIEQPFPIGQDDCLADLKSPIPVAADESVHSSTDLQSALGKYQTVNIKLDKCGGLTEGFRMAQMAKDLGFNVMVGCMLSTALAIAPGVILGQTCDVVDLDSPNFLVPEAAAGAHYDDWGRVTVQDHVWGNAD